MTSEQIPTHLVSTRQIMSAPEFERGFEDVRRGRAFDWRIDDDDWGYVRGRQFGRIAPPNMALRLGGKLNPKAVALCDEAFNRGLMI